VTTKESADATQRFGRIVERHALGSGPHRVTATYFVRDDDGGQTHGFDYSDIVTEGFRTIIVGERVRFEIDPATQRAHFVVRLDLLEVDAFYR
jgi:cold shock CspA family protein